MIRATPRGDTVFVPAELRRSWLRLSSWLLGAALLSMTAGGTAPVWAQSPTSTLPSLGDQDIEALDLPAERKLGDQIMRSVRRDPAYLDDPLLGEYLDRLWQPLLQSARVRGDISPDLERIDAWELFQVRDRSVNAFALPGGFVGVHLGLIALTTRPDELASVLAHELTHVTQRHIVRSMINSQRQSLASTAALIVGLLLATRSNVSPNAAQAVITTGQAAAIQGQLNFSRDMEREADRIGWQILTQAGFAPNGMAAMFEKLDSSHHLNDSNQYPYLRSHPLTIERIADARLRAGDAPMAGSTEALRQHPSPAEHLLMQVRSRVLMDTSEPSLRRAQMLGAPGSPDVTATRLSALYGAALASSLLREPTTAEQALAAGRQLIRSHHGDAPTLHRVFELLHLEILAQRNALQALAQLQTSPLLAQEDARPTLLLRAQVALAAWRAAPDATAAHTALRQSTQALQTRVVLHRQDVLAWQTLAQTAQASGQALRAARAAAEAVAILGDLPGAIDRLRTAQQSVRGDASADYVELSVIQSRLRELEAERRHQAAQAKGEE